MSLAQNTLANKPSLSSFGRQKLSLRSQNGVGMAEVLVSIFVIALGILGLTSMQANAKRGSYDALQRSIATSLTRDFVERIRSNPSSASLAVYGAINNIGGNTITSEPTPNCKTANCTPAQLAAHDIWEWEQALDGASETHNSSNAGGLVSPSACVTHASGVVLVAIAWKGSNGKINPNGSSCGQGLSKYGTNEVDRQLILVTTYIEEI